MKKKLNYLMLISLLVVMSLTLSFASDYKPIRGVDARASLLAGSEQEVFVIDPMVTGDYTIGTTGQVDTYGILYNSENEIIAESDDGDDYDSNFKISATLDLSETYYLYVSGFAYDNTGFYKVYMTKDGLDEEPSASGVKNAEALYTSNPVTSEISRGSEVFYRFTALTDGIYSFASTGEVDTYGVLIDEAGEVIASDDDAYDAYNNFLISETLEKGKTYYLGVGGYNYDTSGTFTVNVQKGSISGAYDDTSYDDYTDVSLSFDSAIVLPFNTDTATTIGEGSIEIYSISPDHDGDYTLMSTGDLDAYGTLYDADANYLSYSDDVTYEDVNFRMDVFLEADKTYYLAVEGFGDDDTGVTQVTWLNTEDAPALETEDTAAFDEEAYQEFLENAIDLKMDVPQAGSFDDGPENLFTFVPEVTGMYTITTTGELDTYGMLYTEDDYVALSDDISDDDYNFEIEVELEANVTYYLYVSYYADEATSPYEIIVKQVPDEN